MMGVVHGLASPSPQFSSATISCPRTFNLLSWSERIYATKPRPHASKELAHQETKISNMGACYDSVRVVCTHSAHRYKSNSRRNPPLLASLHHPLFPTSPVSGYVSRRITRPLRRAGQRCCGEPNRYSRSSHFTVYCKVLQCHWRPRPGPKRPGKGEELCEGELHFGLGTCPRRRRH